MANAEIVLLGFSELGVIVDLHNDVFRPAHERSVFERRIRGRVNPLILLARVEQRPVGFAIGYELKPGSFYCWRIGVLPDFRRMGIASQLMEAMAAWAGENGYHTIRFECFNWQRPMLHVALSQNYDIVGLRFHRQTQDNLIILEHTLSEQGDDE
ncbi:MAG: GNAT family N-acetyltransferase [Phycisphaerae bacterium]|jgi:GNAT superfamily N-acetyltransferase